MTLVVRGDFGMPRAQGLLCGSDHLFLLLFLILFVKQRVVLEVIWED